MSADKKVNNQTEEEKLQRKTSAEKIKTSLSLQQLNELKITGNNGIPIIKVDRNIGDVKDIIQILILFISYS